MKKMLTLFVIALTAMSVHAAALNWQTHGYINDGSAESDWITGGQAYLIQVNDTATFAVSSSLGVTGGTIVDSTELSGGIAAGAWNPGDLIDGTTYYFAVLMTTGGTGMAVPTTGLYGLDLNGGAYYTLTWNADTGAGFMADVNTFEGVAIDQTVAAGNTPSGPGGNEPPVPEPTALALLALGVAGLALRRRA